MQLENSYYGTDRIQKQEAVKCPRQVLKEFIVKQITLVRMLKNKLKFNKERIFFFSFFFFVRFIPYKHHNNHYDFFDILLFLDNVGFIILILLYMIFAYFLYVVWYIYV